MALDSTWGIEHVNSPSYEFWGDALPGELASSSDTGTITVGANTAGVSSVRIDPSNDGDNEMAEVSGGAVNQRAQDGYMSAEFRFLIEATTGAVNLGFNDDALEDSNLLPALLSGTTYTFNAATWIGLVWDSDATDSTFRFNWVDDTVAGTQFDTLITMVAARWYTFKVRVSDAGSGNQCVAEFTLTDGIGRSAQHVASATIDRDALMVWHMGAENRTTTGNFIEVDYVDNHKSRVSN